MSWINYLYIPCGGVKLDFPEFDIYLAEGETNLFVQSRLKHQKKQIFLKHINDDFEDSLDAFRRIGDVDFEILINRNNDDVFNLTVAHAFLFLLIIKTSGWVNAPATLSVSIFEEAEFSGPYVHCRSFLDSIPVEPAGISMNLDDAQWIKDHMKCCIRFMDDPRFQNFLSSLKRITGNQTKHPIKSGQYN